MYPAERFFKLYLILALIILSWGCNTNRAQRDSPVTGKPIELKSSVQTITNIIYVDELVQKAQSFKEKIVTVRGNFMGWQGSCKGPPPETRSDWMLEHGGVCIYVSGPTPVGIERIPNSKDIGREIEIVGRVLLDSGGMPHIKVTHR